MKRIEDMTGQEVLDHLYFGMGVGVKEMMPGPSADYDDGFMTAFEGIVCGMELLKGASWQETQSTLDAIGATLAQA